MSSSRPTLLKPLLPLALTTVLILGGCASLPTETHPEERAATAAQWQAHSSMMRRLTDWSLSGRAAISTDNGGGNVTLRWTQVADAYDMFFSAPLGQGAIRIIGDDRQVLIVDERGREARSNDADSLIRELTGWRVPVTALPAWIRGLPLTDKASFRINNQGLLASTTHGDWTVDYDRYTEQAGFWLPTRIRINAQDISIRLVVDQWDVQPLPGTRIK